MGSVVGYVVECVICGNVFNMLSVTNDSEEAVAFFMDEVTLFESLGLRHCVAPSHRLTSVLRTSLTAASFIVGSTTK
jgi:hypothetical protein